jgi:hypothetical protein
MDRWVRKEKNNDFERGRNVVIDLRVQFDFFLELYLATRDPIRSIPVLITLDERHRIVEYPSVSQLYIVRITKIYRSILRDYTRLKSRPPETLFICCAINF